jgi:hypothetical protein
VPVLNVRWKTPDDGQGNCPKHVEFRTRTNLEISVSVGFNVKKLLTMHGHMNVKFQMGNFWSVPLLHSVSDMVQVFTR